MNVDEVLDTVEQSLLPRQLSSLERFILCQSWLGCGYSQMAADCAYSIAHIKDIGSQLWQTLSRAIGERVTKKNLFLVLKQYLFSHTSETVATDQLSVTFSLVEVIDLPLIPTPNQLRVTTDLIEVSYSGYNEQLPLVYDSSKLVTEENQRLERAQQEYQTSTENAKAEDNPDAAVTQNNPTIASDRLLLDYLLYINRDRLPIERLAYTEISQPSPIRIKALKLRGKSSLLSQILNRATATGYNTVYLDFPEANVTVPAELNQFLGWLCANLSRQLNWEVSENDQDAVHDDYLVKN